jgi:hypothetical protein
LPESPIRDGEASGQLQATPLGFRAKSGQLRLGLLWCGEDDGDKVDEVPVAVRRRPGGTMPLEYRAGLVRDVVDKRIGPVSMLLHIGHDHAGQRRDGRRLIDRWEMWQPTMEAIGGRDAYPMFDRLVTKMRAAV